jgi:ribonuclease HI
VAQKKAHYYAVKAGREPGIYRTWAECQEQVTGFPGAVFRGFRVLAEAQDFLGDSAARPKPAAAEVVDPVPDSEASPDRVVIYTDGACTGNPGPGGYGVVLQNGGKRTELSGGFARTTNNRMELRACIAALQVLPRECSATLHTDSRYVASAMTKGWVTGWRSRGWRREDGPVANVDLWKQLLALCDTLDIAFEWVAGHAGNRENERCDELAVEAAAGKVLPLDEGYKPHATGEKPPKSAPEDGGQTVITFE